MLNVSPYEHDMGSYGLIWAHEESTGLTKEEESRGKRQKKKGGSFDTPMRAHMGSYGLI
jgi:hypothetical protein